MVASSKQCGLVWQRAHELAAFPPDLALAHTQGLLGAWRRAWLLYQSFRTSVPRGSVPTTLPLGSISGSKAKLGAPAAEEVCWLHPPPRGCVLKSRGGECPLLGEKLSPARIRKDLFVLSPNLSGRGDLPLPGSAREGGIRFWARTVASKRINCAAKWIHFRAVLWGRCDWVSARASLRALLRVCVWNGIRWHISSHPVCRTLSLKRDLLAPEHLEAGAL